MIIRFAFNGFADCVHSTDDLVSLKRLPPRWWIVEDNVRKYGEETRTTDRNCGATGSISHFIGRDLLQISDDNEERPDKSDFVCSNSQSFMRREFPRCKWKSGFNIYYIKVSQ